MSDTSIPNIGFSESTESDPEGQTKSVSEILELVNELLGYDVLEISSGVECVSDEYEAKVFGTPGVIEGFEEASALIEEWKRNL